MVGEFLVSCRCRPPSLLSNLVMASPLPDAWEKDGVRAFQDSLIRFYFLVFLLGINRWCKYLCVCVCVCVFSFFAFYFGNCKSLVDLELVGANFLKRSWFENSVDWRRMRICSSELSLVSSPILLPHSFRLCFALTLDSLSLDSIFAF